mmetsp:Transcript_25799/g.19475  ORF Transcript_25799/g.19475 Transcript_25799/m.19475 type:complete len:107 (+) Transcript_25799:155-475(+)|eukprot:CAMPEP_0202971928 /NCGR_PEP_ID=MMETSP1396-20130829/32060_1 /ASSEMBLY_ACC=CAM_ASM_000872 /TAXON_ID= /ORGANISM="Pseudokeronopsis sp., Strain Brazil" /LENGTH=106 /DNA_ID=CAMNT_0049701823 /DNA_START=130 /DNA_END=450 /DNA_ORIENTATION=-
MDMNSSYMNPSLTNRSYISNNEFNLPTIRSQKRKNPYDSSTFMQLSNSPLIYGKFQKSQFDYSTMIIDENVNAFALKNSHSKQPVTSFRSQSVSKAVLNGNTTEED